MKFVGITRFSLVTLKTLGSFRATKSRSIQDAKHIVFDYKKLECRMQSFEKFCFSTYKMFSEQCVDSYGLVLISHDLPEPFQGRLEQLCNSVPRLLLLKLEDHQGIVEVVKPIISEIAGEEPVFSYRYDDDDALPSTYLSTVRKLCTGADVNTVVSFNIGYSLSRYGDNEFEMYVRTYPMNAFGIGVVSDRSDLKTIFELGPHTKITLPTIHEKEHIGWLSTVHQFNDSRVGKLSGVMFSGTDVIDKIASLFPQIELSAIQQLSFRRPSDFDVKISFTKSVLPEFSDVTLWMVNALTVYEATQGQFISPNNNKISITGIKDLNVLRHINIYFSGKNNEVILDGMKNVQKLNIACMSNSSVKIESPQGIMGAVIMASHGSKITIGRDCLISRDVIIYCSSAHGLYDLDGNRRGRRHIHIGNMVWIGQGVRLLAGAHVGDNSVIGSYSILAGVVPNNCAAAGNPCRITSKNIFWTGSGSGSTLNFFERPENKGKPIPSYVIPTKD